MLSRPQRKFTKSSPAPERETAQLLLERGLVLWFSFFSTKCLVKHHHCEQNLTKLEQKGGSAMQVSIDSQILNSIFAIGSTLVFVLLVRRR